MNRDRITLISDNTLNDALTAGVYTGEDNIEKLAKKKATKNSTHYTPHKTTARTQSRATSTLIFTSVKPLTKNINQKTMMSIL